MAELASVLVGRREELAALERVLAQVERGAARSVALRGEPGIGKSRLLAELAGRARERGMLILEGRAAELERDLTFALLEEALEPLAGEPAVGELEPWQQRELVPDDKADEFGRRMLAMAGADAERLFEVSELIDAHHPPGSYYFLQFIGVDPAGQGRGIGSRLMAHMLERCDRKGARAYLDATSQDNKRFYELHGFRASGDYAPAGGPTLWPMWREPRM